MNEIGATCFDLEYYLRVRVRREPQNMAPKNGY